METATTTRPFAPSHIGGNRWNNLRGRTGEKNSNNSKMEKRKGGEGGAKRRKNNPAKRQLRIEKSAETRIPGNTAPSKDLWRERG